MKFLEKRIEQMKVRRSELVLDLISNEEVYDCGNNCRKIQKQIDEVTKQAEYFRQLKGNDRGVISAASDKALDALSSIQGVFDARWVQYNRRAREQMALRDKITALDDELVLMDSLPSKVDDLVSMAYAQPARFKDCVLKLLVVNFDLYQKSQGK